MTDVDLTEPKTVWARRALVQIVDVREHLEFNQGAIDGSVNVSLGELMAGGGEFDPVYPIVLVCKDGARSEIAALMLQARGLDAHNLAGGMEAWEAEGFPFSDATGRAGRVA